MAVGAGSNVGNLSYIAVGRETTYGTYNTCTAGLAVLSSSVVAKKEVKILEEIQTSRTNSNQISLSKTIEGEMEFYFGPRSTACSHLIVNAFGGGAVTSATSTGETIGGGAFTHTININNFDTTYASLCLNIRKGDSTTGKIFQYDGLRVNEFTLASEIDEAVVATVGLVGRDVTVTSNDVASAISYAAQSPLSFVNGRFSIETSTAAITTSSYWIVQNMEWKVSNNLMSDAASRRIGSDVLSVLPAGLATFELKCTIRFDTTTAFDAMMANTRLVGEFEFLGDTMSGSAIREGLKLTMPHLRVMDANDPEIGGPNEMLTSEVTFAVLRDPTASGYAVQAKLTNNIANFT